MHINKRKKYRKSVFSRRRRWSFLSEHITLHILQFHPALIGLAVLRCCVCRCAGLQAARPGSPAATHTHTHTHTHPPTETDTVTAGDPGPGGPYWAQPIQTLWSLWSGERPWLWWICPCKYIPFPLTKHHHMSKPQGPTFCNAQVDSLFTAWEFFTFWGPPSFPLFSKHDQHWYFDNVILNLLGEINN